MISGRPAGAWWDQEILRLQQMLRLKIGPLSTLTYLPESKPKCSSKPKSSSQAQMGEVARWETSLTFPFDRKLFNAWWSSSDRTVSIEEK